MRFFATLAIASLAIAAPTAPIQERQETTVTGSLLTIAQSFQATVLGSVKIIQDSGATLSGQVDAAAEATQKLIADNVATLAAAVSASGGLFQGEVGKLSVTTSSEVEKLSLEQRKQLANAITALQAGVAGIRPIYDIKVTDFTPLLQSTIESEVKLIRDSIGPLVTPVSVFASTVANNAPKVNFDLVGIPAALTGLQGALQSQIAFIGIDLSKAFPGAPTIAVPSVSLPGAAVPTASVPVISPSVPAIPVPSIPSVPLPSAGVPAISAPGAPALAIPSAVLPDIKVPSAGLPALALPTPSAGVPAIPAIKVPSLSIPALPRVTPALPARPN
ncbi:hypothetical protein F5X68DRAFT_233394 [Plectosphaerella plurivora]|uniref:Uncharacterized protein n=1 Tax=Plectosphaerella plurivora TaxID=936078 RepID=A0A9P8VAA9_9PEZI|nr:hypothetical protein F5X68DRAFT_233394 [Plectosphaerella plurivora]